MTGALSHRGPDESGLYLDDIVGFGHARLSIVDLSTGTQPLHNEDGTIWIVYNGEVFNYPELRKKLLERGHVFYTTTDTEVILHLYEEKGPACLADLNGQFALAIWNSITRELFLARDRLGIRPLHYTVQGGNFLFASEIKAIFMHGDISRNLDPEALEQVFTFWTTLPGRTVFREIRELPPGHFMRVASGEVSVRRYWDIPFSLPQEQLKSPVGEICERIGDLLKDAVRIRLRADVPVGSYLSGGLDSSGISEMVRRSIRDNLRTFSIRFEAEKFDESPYIDQMVSALKSDHTDMRAGSDQIGQSFPDVLWHCEKPLLRTAPVPLYLLSREVRNSGVKAVLTGEGADEVFGGYDIFRETIVRKFWSRRPDSKYRPALLARLYPDIFDDPRILPALRSFFAMGIDHPEDPLFSHIVRWQNTRRTRAFFSEDLKNATGKYNVYDELRGHLPGSFSLWDPLSRAQYLEMAIFMSNYLLSSQGDRPAMAHSVEIRLPFLDYRLVEFMGKVPPKVKIVGLKEKFLLKRCFRGMLPDTILDRPKHPYRAPIRDSLLNRNVPRIREALSDRSMRDANLFSMPKVGMLLKKLETVPRASEVDEMALAGIVSSQLIYEQFVSRFPTMPTRAISPNILVDRRSK
jgi:asparagine synthase (glutamine-hydrolysing)